jgi:hypothetical protein
MEDHRLVSQTLAASSTLPGWRRALMHRRCNRVFGKYWRRLADDLPDDGSGTKGLTAMVVSSKLSAAGARIELLASSL